MAAIILNDEATISTKVYRKQTRTDQYLKRQFNHHLEHNRPVVRTLLQRADTIPSTEYYKKEEMAHVKPALAANGYEHWVLKIPKKKDKTKSPSEIHCKKFP